MRRTASISILAAVALSCRTSRPTKQASGQNPESWVSPMVSTYSDSPEALQLAESFARDFNATIEQMQFWSSQFDEEVSVCQQQFPDEILSPAHNAIVDYARKTSRSPLDNLNRSISEELRRSCSGVPESLNLADDTNPETVKLLDEESRLFLQPLPESGNGKFNVYLYAYSPDATLGTGSPVNARSIVTAVGGTGGSAANPAVATGAAASGAYMAGGMTRLKQLAATTAIPIFGIPGHSAVLIEAQEAVPGRPSQFYFSHMSSNQLDVDSVAYGSFERLKLQDVSAEDVARLYDGELNPAMLVGGARTRQVLDDYALLMKKLEAEGILDKLITGRDISSYLRGDVSMDYLKQFRFFRMNLTGRKALQNYKKFRDFRNNSPSGLLRDNCASKAQQCLLKIYEHHPRMSEALRDVPSHPKSLINEAAKAMRTGAGTSRIEGRGTLSAWHDPLAEFMRRALLPKAGLTDSLELCIAPVLKSFLHALGDLQYNLVDIVANEQTVCQLLPVKP